MPLKSIILVIDMVIQYFDYKIKFQQTKKILDNSYVSKHTCLLHNIAQKTSRYSTLIFKPNISLNYKIIRTDRKTKYI